MSGIRPSTPCSLSASKPARTSSMSASDTVPAYPAASGGRATQRRRVARVNVALATQDGLPREREGAGELPDLGGDRLERGLILALGGLHRSVDPRRYWRHMLGGHPARCDGGGSEPKPPRGGRVVPGGGGRVVTWL